MQRLKHYKLLSNSITLFLSCLLAGQVFSQCTFSFTPTSDPYVPYGGGFRQTTLNTSCDGNIGSMFQWINSINVTNGNIISYNVDPNPNSSQRNGYLTFVASDGSTGYFYISQYANPNINNCVSFFNGSTGDQEFVAAANYLCQLNIIPSYFDASRIYTNITLQELALINYKALFPGGSAHSDDFPHPFIDIDYLSVEYRNALLAMLYLEYEDGPETDGISPLTRDYFNISPYGQIDNGKALRMLFEAFDVKPDNTGFDAYGTYSSAFYFDLPVNHKYYGYFKKARDWGLYSGMTCSSNASYCCPNGFMSVRDAYVILYRLLHLSTFSPISNSSYFEPNTFTVSSLGNKADLDRGVFLHYEDPSFSIKGGGLPLEFVHSYHSNWTEIPRYVAESYDTLVYIQRFNPLGIGWTHNYNIYMERVYDISNGQVKYMFWWDDGTVDIYDASQNKWLTSPGRYYTLTSFQSTGTTYFIVTDKEKTKYKFATGSHYEICDLVEIADKNNNTITLSYEYGVNFNSSSVKRLSRVTDDVSGRSLFFFYQPNTNFIQRVQDNSNRSISFYVNGNRDLKVFNDAMGGVYTYNYGVQPYDAHLLKSITKPNGNIVTNQYKERKLKQTQSNSYVIDINFQNPYSGSYYTYSRIDVTKNGQQLTTTVQNDENGMPINVFNNTTRISYTYGDINNPSLPTVIHDQNKNITTNLTYDSRGNVVNLQRTASGLQQSEIFQYDNYYNEVRSYTNARGFTTNYTLDVTGNTVRVDYPDGSNAQLIRNGNGNIESIIHQDGKQSELQYNNYGNLSQYGIVGTNIYYKADYDFISNLRSKTDPRGYKTTYTYDDNDKVIQEVKDPDMLYESTNYFYDANENLTSVRDAEGHNTYMSYDFNTDDLVGEYYGNFSKQWSYNQDGTLSRYTNKNGVNFDISYFPKNDPREGFIRNDGYAQYDYNTTTRNLSTLSKNGKTISLSYDAFGRIRSVGYTDFPGNQVSYQYDQNNNITQISYPFGYGVKYTYDVMDRLATVTDFNSHQLAAYQYYMDGKLRREDHGNGTFTLFFYDNANRLDSIANCMANGDLINAYGYTLDENGNHVEERLNEPYNNGPFQSLPLANNYSSAYIYDNTNRLTSTNFNQWAHDGNGNHLSHGDYAYSYDERDNLLTAYNGNLGVQTTYEYDPLENRRLKDYTRFAIDILNNSNVLVEVSKNTNSPTVVYYHGLGLICRYDVASASYTYYHYDSRGSATALTDAFQNVTNTYRYGTFGEVTSETGSLQQPYKYVGKFGVQYDAQNLYFMRARYYNPYYGRFYGEDPIWSTNLFPYAENNPINNIDPNGDCPVCFALATDAIVNVGIGFIASKISGDKYTLKDLQRDAAFGVIGGALFRGALAGIKMFNYISPEPVISTTLHGTERIAGASATRGGVLSLKGIAATKKYGKSFLQKDGAIVFLNEGTPGKFDVVIESSSGDLITTMHKFSQKSINKLAKNHGWNFK